MKNENDGNLNVAEIQEEPVVMAKPQLRNGKKKFRCNNKKVTIDFEETYCPRVYE